MTVEHASRACSIWPMDGVHLSYSVDLNEVVEVVLFLWKTRIKDLLAFLARVSAYAGLTWPGARA